MPLEHLHLQTEARNPEPSWRTETSGNQETRAIKPLETRNESPNEPARLEAQHEPENWRSLMTLVGWLSRSTIPTGNRNTRSLWSSMILARGTIRLKNPGSGHPGYQVDPDGSDVFGLCNYGHREPSDSDSGWFSLVSPSNPITVVLAPPTNEALVASVLDDFARLHHGIGQPAFAPLAVRERFSPPPQRRSRWLSQSPERRTCYAQENLS